MMSKYFEITDDQISTLRGKVAIITGGSSGIGLATTELLISLGAKVVVGDLNPPPMEHENLTFQTTNVTSWSDLTKLFEIAQSNHGGRIDHVFANAGVDKSTDYVKLEVDSSGQLAEPSFRTYDINLRGVINTSALAFHYMQNQEPAGGSVVATASTSSFQRFSIVDYASAKHGVLGFVRGMVPRLASAKLPIRINGISPSWTVTGMLPQGLAEAAGKPSQPASAVARSVAILMADETRTGQVIYSVEGKYREIDENVLLKANKEIFGDEIDDDTVIQRIGVIVAEMRKKGHEGKRASRNDMYQMH